MVIGLFNGRPKQRRIPERLWGMSIQSLTGFNAAVPTPYHDLGQSVFRLWDTDTTWRRLEPAKGGYNTSRLDGLLSIAEANGLFVLYTMGQAPAFATGGTPGGPYTGSGIYNNKVPSLTDWADHVAWISSTYAGRIHAYELWNECDITDFWAGSIADLMGLIEVAVPIIRANDPDALIIGPSFTGGNAPKIYIDLYAQAGLGALVDGFAYHSYVFPLQPEAIIGQAALARAAMVRHGLSDKLLWQTECSWYTYYDETSAFVDKYQAGGAAMSNEIAASYLVRMYLGGIAAGFDCHVFYGMDYPYSHIRVLNFSDKTQVLPAGNALRFCAETLRDMVFIGVRQDDALWTYSFFGVGGPLKVLFCQDRRSIAMDTTGFDLVTDVTGDPVEKSTSAIITMSPLYCWE